MYAIVDIETTGGNTNSDRITEIAILIHDGEKVVEEFASLVNPGKRIPYRISSITGITNEMVAEAPKFYEIAKQIVEMTEGKTFVAHNAKFDYNFVKNEFKALGYEYKRKKLCTVEMSRSLIPGLKSYALGKLCKTLGIVQKIHHRALEDANATAALFRHLIELREGRSAEPISETRLSRMSPEANLHKEQIDQLPNETGVYYFYNAWHQLIYIGKSVDIRSRVLSHFANNTTTKALEMKESIRHIRYAITGSELIALLKESEEIKRNKPPFNRAQRRSRFHIGLFVEEDQAGYLRLRTERIRPKSPHPVTAFASARHAKSFVSSMLEEYELCQKLVGLHRLTGPCFHYSIHKCHGACVGNESPEDYNLRVQELLARLEYTHSNLMIIDQGRHEGERSLVLVENGKYLGYGYIEKELIDNDVSMLRSCIQPFMDNKDVRQIINLYLRQEKPEKVVKF